jgi:hypothetical protein
MVKFVMQIGVFHKILNFLELMESVTYLVVRKVQFVLEVFQLKVLPCLENICFF